MDSKFKELQGPLTNTVQAEAVIVKDGDDDFENDPGNQLGQRTYITLVIGDWEGALQCLVDVPEVYVRIGPAGTGRTRWLHDNYGTSGYAIAPDNTGRWYDGCDRDVVLF